MMSLGLTGPSGGKSTPNAISESVEWLCANADLVVVGQIVSTKDLRGGGKSVGLMSFLVRGKSLGAGSTAGTFGIAVRDVSLEQLDGLRDAQTQIVVFLRRTIQGFVSDGKSYHLWPLRYPGGGHWVVPLASTETPLLSARSGTVITDIGSLDTLCSTFAKPAGAPLYPAPPRAYLPVPADAALVKVLGAQAPKHLIVPAVHFPGAAKTQPVAP